VTHTHTHTHTVQRTNSYTNTHTNAHTHTHTPTHLHELTQHKHTLTFTPCSPPGPPLPIPHPHPSLCVRTFKPSIGSASIMWSVLIGMWSMNEGDAVCGHRHNTQRHEHAQTHAQTHAHTHTPRERCIYKRLQTHAHTHASLLPHRPTAYSSTQPATSAKLEHKRTAFFEDVQNAFFENQTKELLVIWGVHAELTLELRHSLLCA